MVERKKAWNNTCNRFVAFLDIMGFKDMVFRKSHEDVKKMLESLHPTIKLFEDLIKGEFKIKELKEKLEEDYSPSIPLILPVSFSDSIIFISGDSSISSLAALLEYIKIVFFQAISEGIPMKGAIACGEMTADKDNSLFFGRPLIDAFELQNELQLYGVVLHNTVEKRFSELKMQKYFENYDIFKYSVPMKSGKITHYLIDWTQGLFAHNELKDHIQDAIIAFSSDLYNNVSGAPRMYVDNTLEFVRWVTKKKAKLKQKKENSKP
jgi:hypothetical protein